MEFTQLATRFIILYKCVNDLYVVYFERFLQMHLNVYIFIFFKVFYIFEISKEISYIVNLLIHIDLCRLWLHTVNYSRSDCNFRL